MREFRTIDDLEVAGRAVLLRVDLNVPMAGGQVTDATRLERAAGTVAELAGRGARVVEAPVYRRVLPDVDPAPLREALAGGAIDAVVVTSVEAAQNLFLLAGNAGAAALRDLGFVGSAGERGEGEEQGGERHRLNVVAPAGVATSRGPQIRAALGRTPLPGTLCPLSPCSTVS